MYGQPHPRRLALLAILLALGITLPFVLPVYYLYLGNVLMMYAVLAIGLDLLLGWSGQFAFAHIAFFGIGIYGTALLHMRLGIPFVIGMPVAALVAGAVGWLIARPSTRLRTVYLALATYAFAECAQWVYRTWDSLTGGSDGLRIKPPSVLGFETGTDPSAFPIVTVILCLMLLATLYLTRSKFGRHLAAIRDSEHVAAASGIDVNGVKIAAFTLSAVYAGVAGGVYTLYQSFVNPDVLGVAQLVLVLTMVVVGGPGSIVGALLGVVLIGLLPEVLRAAPRGLLVWQEFFYGLILVLAVMFMPRGLWGLIEPHAKVGPKGKPDAAKAASGPVAPMASLDLKVTGQ
jgi:branched-chain amino acid transport system permease protein